MLDAYIYDGLRSPIGRHAGKLAPLRPDDLAGEVIKAVVARNKLDPKEISDVVLGCVNQAGEDNRNVARFAALLSGLPPTTPGVTVNRLCASGLQAVVDSALIVLDIDTVGRVAAAEIEVVAAIATMLAARVRYDLRLIAVRTLGSLPERLALDLLERASRSQLAIGRLEVRATQEALAASIGSSREVVSRALKTLRDARIVETTPGMTRLLDPIRLAEIVRTFDI